MTPLDLPSTKPLGGCSGTTQQSRDFPSGGNCRSLTAQQAWLRAGCRGPKGESTHRCGDSSSPSPFPPATRSQASISYQRTGVSLSPHPGSGKKDTKKPTLSPLKLSKQVTSWVRRGLGQQDYPVLVVKSRRTKKFSDATKPLP